MKHKIIVGFIVIIAAIFLISCSSKSVLKTMKEANPYSKEGTSEYSNKIDGDSITIDSSCSELKITKSDTDEIKVSMKKSVSGDKEDTLQEALDNIKCTFEDSTIKIGPEKSDDALINSKMVVTTLSIPNNINSLDIKSNVGDINLEGDYKRFNLDKKVGELNYKGDLKEGTIVSNVGDVNLDLKNLNSSYKYDISGNVGDVTIKVPKDSSINLTGASSKEVKLGEGINSSTSGATFEINRTVSRIKINS